MALHLLKLCVGAETVENLESWIDRRLSAARGRGEATEQTHTTRMCPKRAEELLEGGSLYWVIKGNVQVRQRLIDIRPFTDSTGISRCDFVLDPELRRTRWQPRRPFQGWRYLKPEDAPDDLSDADAGILELPPHLQRELAALGLL